MILLQIFGNALLMWLLYYWLGIGEANAGQLLWSALVALLIAAAACCLHGAAFEYFRESPRRLRPAFGVTLRHLLPMLAAVIAIGVVYLFIFQIADWCSKPAFTIASYLTQKLRTPIKPASLLKGFLAVLWVVRWIVLPVLLLPMVAGIASRGWSGFGAFGARARSWRYWIEALALTLLALWIPFRLVGWVPHANSFSMEMISFLARATAGYLLFVGAWLLLVFITSSGTPRLSQPSTVPSP